MKKATYIFVFIYLFLLSWDGYFLLSTGLPFSLSFIPLGVIGIVFLSQILVMRKSLYIDRLLIPLILLLLYMFVSMLWAPTIHINSYIILLSYFMTLFIINYLVKVQKINISVIYGYFLGVLTIGLFTYSTGEITQARFSITEGFNPTWYAAQILWAIVISVYFIQNTNFLSKVLLIAADVFLLFLLILTGGRNAFIALVLSLTISILYLYRFKAKKIIKYTFMFLVLVTSTYYIIEATVGLEILDRFIDIRLLIEGDSSRATAGRTDIWINYLNVINEYVIFGSGFKSSSGIVGESAHNIYITVLFETGIIGILLLLLFIQKLIMVSLKVKNTLSITILAMSLALLLLGFGNDTLYYKYWWTGFLVFIILIDKFKMETVIR